MIAPLGIANAALRTVGQSSSSQPDVSSALIGWSEPIQMVRVFKHIVDRETVNEEKPFTCSGMIQPFSARELSIKSEGERSWKWYMLHTTPDVDLNTGEEFFVDKIKYKVMGKLPYSRNGYVQYELIQTYQS
jgi:hypothetical protein